MIATPAMHRMNSFNTPKTTAIAVLFLLPLLSLSALGDSGMASRLFENMKPEPVAPGAPKKSDVCLSSRWPHPKNADDPYDTFEVCGQFHATRLEWVYTADPDFIAKANQKGLAVMATLNGNMSDEPGEEEYEKGGSYEKGRMHNPQGQKVAAPWMTWKPIPYMGCANSPEYKQNILSRAITILDAGAAGLQFDDPPLNIHSKSWDVCFCSYCNTGFTSYLKNKLSESSIKALGVDDIDTFSYKAYRLDEEGSKELKMHFVDYQTQVAVDYHKDIQATLEKKYNRQIPFSSNNYGISWAVPHNLFDFGVCELSGRLRAPKDIYPRVQNAYELGKSQVTTFHTKEVAQSRRLIGTLYAFGVNPIVPWDVWMKGSTRYYGTPEDYADLYGFVRSAPALFDGYSMVTVESFDIPDTNGDLIQIEENKDVLAVMRATGDLERPLVIHLVDWSKEPEPFVLMISQKSLPSTVDAIKLMVPVEYDEALHDEAEEAKGYSKLRKPLKVNSRVEGEYTYVQIPALDPWGILVIE